VGLQGLLPGPVDSPPTLLLSVGLALEPEAGETLLAMAGVLTLVPFWFGGGFGGLILRLGTVGVDGEAVGTTFTFAGSCPAETWVPGVVFACILILLVRVCAVERVWMVGVCNNG
jgi:hypothetical protein